MSDTNQADRSSISALRFVDSHLHLDDDAFASDRESVLAAAVTAGVKQFVNIGYCPSVWRSTIRLARSAPRIAFTLGVHPQHADHFNDGVRAELRSLLTSSRATAIGEIGLDYARLTIPPSRQQDVFMSQLELAQELALPVVIHHREAEADLIGTLGQVTLTRPVVLHSFEGSRTLARFAVDRGYYFGIGGLFTRPTSEVLRAIVGELPLSRLLLETDSPYLVPVGLKGRRNVPANVPVIAARLAEALGKPVAEIAEQTTTNAHNVFTWERSANERSGASGVNKDGERPAAAGGHL